MGGVAFAAITAGDIRDEASAPAVKKLLNFTQFPLINNYLVIKPICSAKRTLAFEEDNINNLPLNLHRPIPAT